MKWARVETSGQFIFTKNLSLDDPNQWIEALKAVEMAPETTWAIASVNPPVARQFATILRGRGHSISRVYDSAAKVALPTTVNHLETAGADRALAVLAALHWFENTGPGLVISCGTAITVERINRDGVWEGGAIGAGLSLVARSLHQSTAQLPLVTTLGRVLPWGDSTAPAIAAGVFWGTVGTVRELIACQNLEGWRIWTGGDAETLATAIGPPTDRDQLVPNLVLRGLALAEFGIAVVEDFD